MQEQLFPGKILPLFSVECMDGCKNKKHSSGKTPQIK